MIVSQRINSRHIAGNLLNDPAERDLFVYLPPSYHSSGARYPTVYLLHWFGRHAAELITPRQDEVKWHPPFEDVLDPVFGRQNVTDMIVVIPDGWSKYGCSQWVDSPVNGNFEQYILHEVVPHVDSAFRTIPRPASRGIFGLSSGGFGAWHLASRHPDIFGAMALLSADSYFDLTHKPFLYKFYDAIYPDAPSGPLEDNPWSQLSYGCASCYSPNVDSPPFYVDFPVALSGEVIQPIWQKWLAFDPVINWEERADNLRQLRGILLDHGRADEFDLQWGQRILSERLRGANIAHHVEEHAGNHSGRQHERHQFALKWLSETLDFQS